MEKFLHIFLSHACDNFPRSILEFSHDCFQNEQWVVRGINALLFVLCFQLSSAVADCFLYRSLAHSSNCAEKRCCFSCACSLHRAQPPFTRIYSKFIEPEMRGKKKETVSHNVYFAPWWHVVLCIRQKIFSDKWKAVMEVSPTTQLSPSHPTALARSSWVATCTDCIECYDNPDAYRKKFSFIIVIRSHFNCHDISSSAPLSSAPDRNQKSIYLKIINRPGNRRNFFPTC